MKEKSNEAITGTEDATTGKSEMQTTTETGKEATGAKETKTGKGISTDKAPKPEQKKPEKVVDAVVSIGKKLLKSHPSKSVIFMTSDGQGFFAENDAFNHATTLKNKVVTPVNK